MADRCKHDMVAEYCTSCRQPFADQPKLVGASEYYWEQQDATGGKQALRSREEWTQAEDQKVLRLVAEGKTATQIAAVLKRSYSAVKDRLEKLDRMVAA